MTLTETQVQVLQDLKRGAQLIAAYGNPAAHVVGWHVFAPVDVGDCYALDGLGFIEFSHSFAGGTVSHITPAGLSALAQHEAQA